MKFNFTTEEIIIRHKNDVLYKKPEKNYPVVYLLSVARVDKKYIWGSGYKSKTWPAAFVLVSDVGQTVVSLGRYLFIAFLATIYTLFSSAASARVQC